MEAHFIRSAFTSFRDLTESLSAMENLPRVWSPPVSGASANSAPMKDKPSNESGEPRCSLPAGREASFSSVSPACVERPPASFNPPFSMIRKETVRESGTQEWTVHERLSADEERNALGEQLMLATGCTVTDNITTDNTEAKAPSLDEEKKEKLDRVELRYADAEASSGSSATSPHVSGYESQNATSLSSSEEPANSSSSSCRSPGQPEVIIRSGLYDSLEYRPSTVRLSPPSQPPPAPVFDFEKADIRPRGSMTFQSRTYPQKHRRRDRYNGNSTFPTAHESRGFEPGDIVCFDFPSNPAFSSPAYNYSLPFAHAQQHLGRDDTNARIHYYGIYAGEGYILHCFNLSDPASSAVPWVLTDWQIQMCSESILWTAHAVVLLHRLCEFCRRGALGVRVCNRFDTSHRVLPADLIVSRANSRLNQCFPDYLNPGFWTSLSFACWSRYCVPHPNPMASFKPTTPGVKNSLLLRTGHRMNRIHSETPPRQQAASLVKGDQEEKRKEDSTTF